jgi:tryptophan-rich sensory protein
MTNTPSHATTPLATPPWTALVFALAALFIGMLPAGLTFALDPGSAGRIGLDAIPIPVWLVTAIWMIIYPGMGIAAWQIWRLRARVDVSVPLAIFSAGMLQSLSFWLTNSIRMTALIDATGVLLACTVAYVATRYAKTAVWWLLPWLVWMPITLGIKLWALAHGAN